MPNLHDIERRINSVKSTKQITRTMEMVAAAKIRRATERVEAATPYSTSMMEMLGHLAAQTSGSEAPLLEVHENTNRVLIVVVVSDRGLAGGFNSNVLRRAEGLMREYKAAGAQVDVIACGKKAQGYFHYRKINPVLAFKDLSADPTVEEAEEVAKYAIEGYSAGTLDKVVIVYNHAKNAAEQVLTEEVVLPVDAEAFAVAKDAGKLSGDTEFEPSAEVVLNGLLPAYVRTTIYHALIDSAAGEQAARRSAMKSATDNANEMVDTLTRIYNRARQGAITTEINEIVGGAAALEG
ncbi:MAG: ATP synthase F1 subunit gamma [Eggerthellaceae bacterium]|nr:ATP synthase F1 subunit gamma [Eggerthellaceae bacterium]